MYTMANLLKEMSKPLITSITSNYYNNDFAIGIGVQFIYIINSIMQHQWVFFLCVLAVDIKVQMKHIRLFIY